MATLCKVTEAYTKESLMVRFFRGSVGVLAHGMSVEKHRELGRPYKLLIEGKSTQ